MADKDVVAEIRRRREAWPVLAVEALRRSTQDLGRVAHPNGLAVTLSVLVGELREVAELYGRAKMRGAKGEIDELNAAARVLDGIAAGLRSLDEPAAAPSRGGPSVPAEWCGKTEDHGPHLWELPLPEGADPLDRDPLRRECLGRHATSTAGLDALIAERVASPVGASRATEAYLTGAVNDIPGSPPLGPGSVAPAPPDEIERALQPTPGVEFDQVLAADAARIRDLFDDPAPVGWANATTSPEGYRLPGNVPVVFDDPPPLRGSLGVKLSWGDVRDLIGKDRRGAGLPEHLSHSQIDTLGECGLKYVMQRDEQLGVVQTPQWALIGGNAFHAAVEWFERVVAEVRQLQHVRDRLLTFARQQSSGAQAGEAAELLWQWAFGRLITETAMGSPVPQDEWRASKQGMEGYTWWLINGGDMVQRYLDARLIEIGGAGWRSIKMAEGAPMIEHEFTMPVEVAPFTGFIDQVWDVTEQHGSMRAGDLLIDDCKSGAKVGGDTTQLGEYALWLMTYGPGLRSGQRIWGRFYDARKGTWTEPVDLLAQHSWDELTVRVLDADAKKAGGLFAPHRTNFCGGCSVKHACPIFALAS